MPRKPNYRFDRQERERAKAKKKEERLKAKAERRAGAETSDSIDEGEASTDDTKNKASENE